MIPVGVYKAKLALRYESIKGLKVEFEKLTTLAPQVREPLVVASWYRGVGD